MLIEIKRNQTNRLYTEGVLNINDLKTTYTVEHTLSMLPVGEYRIRLAKDKKRRRVIGIFPKAVESLNHKPSSINLQATFESSGTWISSKKNRTICIGEPIMPGALKKGKDVYERLFDRIEKAEDRGEGITLQITDRNCTQSTPIRYWTEPSDHDCPASTRRVEVDTEGNATIYEHNKQVAYLSIEQQIANRLTQQFQSL